ncbi:MAG TPA: acyltransferase family protein, partial [Puia sp.]|nr:acyltransferase family protein [Puia sp.]
HCFSPVYYQFGPIREWAAANIFFGFAIRWSVAVFVMISGALLLRKDEPLAAFYKSRFLRICLPLIAWTILYGMARLYYFKVYTYDKQPEPSFWRYVLFDGFKSLFYDRLSYHLYFISIILGLYLISPFLGKMVRALSKRELGIFVLIGVGIYSLRLFLPGLILINDFAIGSYLVYFLLGYYLFTYPPEKKLRMLIYTVAIGAAIGMTWLNYVQEYVHKGHQDINYQTDGFFVYMLCIGIFVFFQHAIRQSAEGPGILKKLVLFISSNSYGIYIAHPLLISFLVYGTFSWFRFSTARFVLTIPGYRLTFFMNNAWGAIVQSLIMMGVLLLFFYLVKKLRLSRYFT